MNKKIFLGIGIFWILIILGFVAMKEFTLKSGTEVLLKTRPVDPRDLFRGDYVILRYDISNIDYDENIEFRENEGIYILLNIDNEGYGEVSRISQNKPLEGLYLKGTVTKTASRVIGGSTQRSVSVEYGIESYFVPEGKGWEIERHTGKNLSVRVAVDKLGNSVIENLLVDGEEFSFDS